MPNAAAEKQQRNTAPTSHCQKQSWWQPFADHNSPPNTICQQAAQDVARQFIGEGVASVQHITRPACTATKLGTLLGYVDVSQPTSRRIPNHGINHEPMQSVSSHNNLPISITYSYIYTMKESKAEPAPTIMVQISTSTGTCYIEVLPDSGADISAAGQGVLKVLGQQTDDILPSNISPRTVNGTSMTPLGRVPVTIQLCKAVYEDDLHIYPGVSGALISSKVAKG